MTVEEAGALCGLSRSSAYDAVRRGELPVLRFGRRLMVPTARLRVMLGIDPEPVNAEEQSRLSVVRT
ncbi:MAG TPA: helix-turn-helix domain-containing protein [Acidimicrobiales bacterium]|nr:helix-turn-helix domain-containing protein [Acidimicrobiales bacterium]